ncbi:MAG: rhodanese-like domain-containing protein [Clostridium sp.]|nr:rhodanese-like domain-containing protein [Clostridium sp.]
MHRFYKQDEEYNIDVNKIDELLGNIELIDIREDYEYNEGSIRTAKNIPMRELLMDPEEYLEKDKKYYILCRSGVRSARTCLELREEGYDVVNVSGGVIDYRGNNISNL